MSLSNAYGISKYLTDETGNVIKGAGGYAKANPDYKKYFAIKMAAVFGYYPQLAGDKLMMANNGMHAMFFDGKEYYDMLFMKDITDLKVQYNRLALKNDQKDAKKLYDTRFNHNYKNTHETYDIVYSEEDPAVYSSYIAELMDQEHKEAYIDLIDNSMSETIKCLEKTSWGKEIANAIGKYWNNNDYIVRDVVNGKTKEQPEGSQPGEE